METMEEIEKNILFWLTKKKIDTGLDKEEEHTIKILKEKYTSFGFWCFNYHSGFFKGLPEHKRMEEQLKANPYMSVV